MRCGDSSTYNSIEPRSSAWPTRESSLRELVAGSYTPPMANIRENSRQQAAPWIYNSWLDLIVGCGAWSAPLLWLSYSSVASSARTWSVVFYVLAFFFNYPHYMATLYRAYRRSEDLEKYRVFTVHVTALVVLALLLSHFWARLLPWIFTIYLTWSPCTTADKTTGSS